MSSEVRQFTVQHDDDGVRLDRWFKRHLPQIGFAMISRWARTGQIRVDGKRADPADRLSAGQVVRVPPGGDAPAKGGAKPRRELSEEEIARAEAMVITQDRAAIVLNKPPGLATQGGSGMKEHVDGLLDAFAHDGPRPRLVHRLDKDTSGVLLIARTPGSAAYFSKRFSGRTARKIYWAIITGVPDIADGLIELPLAKQPGTGGEKMMVDKSGEGQSARTRYRVLDRAGNRAAWVELQPLTGRTHQLRVHMAAIGHPIVGDGKYGGPEAFLSGSISRKMHLHARRLIIDHPDGDVIDVRAELPEHFANTMASLGFDEDDGDALPEPYKPGKADEKQAAKAHAKQVRKERRGERRGRADGRVATRKPVTKALAKRGPTKGKGSPRPAAKGPGAKPTKPTGKR
ncbi:MAG: RluA family pseudouridine synthase [Pseudomonadota bacterium]